MSEPFIILSTHSQAISIVVEAGHCILIYSLVWCLLATCLWCGTSDYWKLIFDEKFIDVWLRIASHYLLFTRDSIWIFGNGGVLLMQNFGPLRADLNWKNSKNFSFWPEFFRPPPPSLKKGPTNENIGISYLIVIIKFDFF